MGRSELVPNAPTLSVVAQNPLEFAKAPRVGCVKYLNARPLVHGLPGEVLLDHPTKLCEKLADGSLEVALVSSFEFLRNPIYVLVDGVCIASHGPVYSVFLAHAGELDEIDEIEVDPSSQASFNLLRCLLGESKLAPKLALGNPLLQRAVTPRLAKFLIGDQAIHFRERTAGALRFWDLGEEWEKLTHLPFVYALWLIRPEVPCPKQIADRLRTCRDDNLRDLDSLIAAEKKFSPQFCAHYFRKCLTFHLGPAEKKGLMMFQKLCERHRFLPPQRRAVL
jgi:chorismate dehydratase